MLENYDIVTFGSSDWWGDNPRCCTHIMRRLSARNKVIHINPISSDLLGIRTGKGLYKRMVRKFKSLLKFVRRVDRDLYVFSPVFLPFQGNPVIDWVNNNLLKVQIGILMFSLRIKKPLLWIDNIRAADLINSFNWQLIIYHASDRFEECPYTHNKEKLEKREACVSNSSDLIICVSRELYESKKNLRTKVCYMPHGVDFGRIREAVEGQKISDRLYQMSRPIAGYFGTLTAQNDIELLEYCAANMKDVTFVFAGKVTGGDYSELARMPNVVFLGWVPYEEIPSLCATFDVCLLPWKMNKWIRSCNPYKFMEYMASCKPIVSVAIRELMQYSDVVSIAHSKEEFCDAIRWELKNDMPERANRRIEIAKEHSWDKQIERLSRIITNAMAAKKSRMN